MEIHGHIEQPHKHVHREEPIDLPKLLKNDFIRMCNLWNDEAKREDFFNYFDENCKIYNLGYGFENNMKGFKDFVHMMWNAISNGQLFCEYAVCERDHCSARFMYKGTHNGEFPPGLKPQFKLLHFRWTMYMVYGTNGKITECHIHIDDMNLIRELGLENIEWIKRGEGPMHPPARSFAESEVKEGKAAQGGDLSKAQTA